MSKNPIIIIDDDQDDLDIIRQAFDELKTENEIIFFNDGYKFLDFIKNTDKKFLFILCDINMGKMTGLELKKILHADKNLRVRCIPFLFYSTSRASLAIMEAYSVSAQGYFIKPTNIGDIKKMINCITTYWGLSQHPNSI